MRGIVLRLSKDTDSIFTSCDNSHSRTLKNAALEELLNLKALCYNMFMQQYESPIHFDRHGASMNLNLFLALGVAAIGILLIQEAVIVVVGLSFAAFAWLTTPSMYSIYSNHLVIAYGRPRVRNVFFQNIEEIVPIQLPFGSRLVVRLRRGGRLLMQPRDVEGFSSQLNSALESFRSEHGDTSGSVGGEDVVDVDPQDPDQQS